MKKILALIFCLCCVTLVTVATVRVYSEKKKKKSKVADIYQDSETGKFYMTFYIGRELKVASISKTEMNKYFKYKEKGISFRIILQELKTKWRIVIKVDYDEEKPFRRDYNSLKRNNEL